MWPTPPLTARVGGCPGLANLSSTRPSDSDKEAGDRGWGSEEAAPVSVAVTPEHHAGGPTEKEGNMETSKAHGGGCFLATQFEGLD